MKSILFSAILAALAVPQLAAAAASQTAPAEKPPLTAEAKARPEAAATPKERAKVAKKQSKQGKKAKKAKQDKPSAPKA